MYCNAVKSTCLKLCLDFSSVTACYASSHRWLPVVAVMSHAIPYSAPHPPASRDKLNTCFRERFAISLPHYFGLGYGIRRGTNMRLRCVFALQTADAAGGFFLAAAVCAFLLDTLGRQGTGGKLGFPANVRMCMYVGTCFFGIRVTPARLGNPDLVLGGGFFLLSFFFFLFS